MGRAEEAEGEGVTYQAKDLPAWVQARAKPKQIYAVPTLSDWRRANLMESFEALCQRRLAWSEKMDREALRAGATPLSQHLTD